MSGRNSPEDGVTPAGLDTSGFVKTNGEPLSVESLIGFLTLGPDETIVPGRAQDVALTGQSRVDSYLVTVARHRTIPGSDKIELIGEKKLTGAVINSTHERVSAELRHAAATYGIGSPEHFKWQAIRGNLIIIEAHPSM